MLCNEAKVQQRIENPENLREDSRSGNDRRTSRVAHLWS